MRSKLEKGHFGATSADAVNLKFYLSLTEIRRFVLKEISLTLRRFPEINISMIVLPRFSCLLNLTTSGRAS